MPDSANNGHPRTIECWRNGISEKTQAAWVDLFVPLLMAKDPVIGVYWHRMQDEAATSIHRYPGCALWNEAGQQKAAVQKIIKYRQAFWETNG